MPGLNPLSELQAACEGHLPLRQQADEAGVGHVLFNQNCLYEKRHLITFPVKRSQKKAENDCSIPRRVKTISCSMRSGLLSFYQN
jgi:hypothetical protein